MLLFCLKPLWEVDAALS